MRFSCDCLRRRGASGLVARHRPAEARGPGARDDEPRHGGRPHRGRRGAAALGRAGPSASGSAARPGLGCSRRPGRWCAVGGLSLGLECPPGWPAVSCARRRRRLSVGPARRVELRPHRVGTRPLAPGRSSGPRRPADSASRVGPHNPRRLARAPLRGGHAARPDGSEHKPRVPRPHDRRSVCASRRGARGAVARRHSGRGARPATAARRRADPRGAGLAPAARPEGRALRDGRRLRALRRHHHCRSGGTHMVERALHRARRCPPARGGRSPSRIGGTVSHAGGVCKRRDRVRRRCRPDHLFQSRGRTHLRVRGERA